MPSTNKEREASKIINNAAGSAGEAGSSAGGLNAPAAWGDAPTAA